MGFTFSLLTNIVLDECYWDFKIKVVKAAVVKFPQTRVGLICEFKWKIQTYVNSALIVFTLTICHTIPTFKNPEKEAF